MSWTECPIWLLDKLAILYQKAMIGDDVAYAADGGWY